MKLCHGARPEQTEKTGPESFQGQPAYAYIFSVC